MPRFLVRTAALLLIAAGIAGAQEYRATLLGVVLDPTGAIVPGAAVTATNVATGVSTTAQANANGNYIIPYLLPGTYRLRVDHAGFKTFERSPIELRVNDRMRVDVELEIGAASDRVTVTAEGPLLEMSSASRGQVVDNRQISELPVNAKNPFNLTNLAAGVQYTRVNTLFFSAFDQSAIGMFSINGGVSNFNEFQIDGVSDTAITGAAGPDLAYVPPVEATQEFKVGPLPGG